MSGAVFYQKIARNSGDGFEEAFVQQDQFVREPRFRYTPTLFQRIPRRTALLSALVCFVLIAIGFSATTHHTQTLDPFSNEPLSILIEETGGYHDEVIAALIHSFGSQPNAELELYQRDQRYGIKEILDQFQLARPLPAYKPFGWYNATTYQPTILVSTTCEVDSFWHGAQWATLLKLERTFLFCIIHHADQWGAGTKTHDVLKPWVQKGLVNFVALSEHTQNFLDTELKTWDLGDAQPVTRHLVPVFPVDLSSTKYASTGSVQDDNLFFALQGNYESTRRDYGKIFQHLGNFLDHFRTEDAAMGNSGSVPDIQLRLLGHGSRPTVPDPLLPHVKFDENLAYLDFYGILSQTFALLPAFANDEYLDRKASSSVPAGLIAGTPLVATQAILDAYTYLPRDAVWVQADDEEDFDVVGRVLKMEPQERMARKLAVGRARDERIELNKRLVANWIREGRAKIVDMAQQRL